MMQQRSERSFGLSVGTVCALLAAWDLWRGRAVIAEVLGIVALTLLVPALLRPSLLRVPSALWWRLAHGLGWVNSRVLLSALFVVVMTPVAIILRWTRWDPLRVRRGRQGSGWVASPQGHQDPRHYERMY